jgi:hypothetical protein
LIEDSEVGDTEFVREADGWLKSHPIRNHRRWFRVVCTPPGEPVQFSRQIAWDPDDPASHQIKVEVRPGVRVKGKISDEVPRPIKWGHVVAWCGSPGHEDAVNVRGRREPIWWIDWTEVKEDGTFEFTSLPSGYLAQVFAIANDWISAPPTDEAFETCAKWFSKKNEQRNEFFRLGQIQRLAGIQSSMTIEMEKSGQARIKCVDPDGRPLRRISVYSWPNQYTVAGGSSVFCRRASSLDSILGRGEGYDWAKSSPYSAVTNDDGEAVIRNLPEGKQPLSAGGSNWVLQQTENVEVDLEKTAEITLTLQPGSE